METAVPTALATHKPSRVRTWLIWIGAVLGALAATGLAFCWYIGVLGENFRTIAPNQCFRSAQVTPRSIQKHVAEQQIKCVVNLRGHSHNDWYTKELAACEQAGIEHFDFKFDPNFLPPPETLKELIARFEQGPYPMLLHCRAGADRSSLAAVLYEMIVAHQPLDEAIGAQMTWRVGHLKYDSGDGFLELYRKYGEGLAIKEWILQKYPAVYEKEGGGKRLFDAGE